MSSITWWLEVATLAFAGGLAIGFGVSWLFLPFRSQAEPGALSEWPPMLGASQAGDSDSHDFELIGGAYLPSGIWAEQWRRREADAAGALDHEQG
jgi:hypothetical protein